MLKYHLSKFFFPLLLIFSSWVQADTSYRQIFVFGDSLSDTGNLASVIGDFPAPYYMNRVSNGPVAVETLAAKLGLTATASLHLLGLNNGGNYAVAGANAFGDEAIDLNTQIISFQVNHGFVAPKDALYVIFIGGNDVRSARDEPDLAIAESLVKAAANEVRHSIENLAQIGARSFLLVNTPNIGIIPETHLVADNSNNPDLQKRARKLSQLYRELLQDIAEQLEDENRINISEFDLFKFFNKLVKKAERYNFINTTDACFDPVSYPDTFFHPDCAGGANANQFVFFDSIHPTARVHELAGEAFFETLNHIDTCDCVRVKI